MGAIVGRMDLFKRPLRGPIGAFKMLQSLRHRGPDGQGVISINLDGRPGSGECLPTDDVPALGWVGSNGLRCQHLPGFDGRPKLSPCGRYLIACDGEISNSEGIPVMLARDGVEKTIARLNGLFALVIYDCEDRKLYLARDRFGGAPLHYCLRDGVLTWASEIKAFIALSDFDRRLDRESTYIAFKYAYTDACPFANVKSVAPGTYVCADIACGTIETRRYFDATDPESWEHADSWWLPFLLRRAVAERMSGDELVGSQLSGGIDSSLVASIASDLYAKSGGNLRSYAVVCRDYPCFSEEMWIDRAASRMSVEVQKTDLTPDRFLDSLVRATLSFEKPIAYPSVIGLDQLVRSAKDKVSVLLSGDGADEFALGYRFFRSVYLKYGMNRKNVGWGTDDNLHSLDAVMGDDDVKQLLGYACPESVLDRRRALWTSFSGNSVERLRALYMTEVLPATLERQNKICMAYSIANRLPFLDQRLVSWLMHSPTLPMLGKLPLKLLAAERFGLPFAFRRKQSLWLPYSQYLATPAIRRWVENEILPSVERRGILNGPVVRQAFSNLSDSKSAVMAWRAITFEIWLRLFVD